MTTKIKPEPKEKKELIWTSQEKENHKSEYGCEIIIENGTLEQVSTTMHPLMRVSSHMNIMIRFVVI